MPRVSAPELISEPRINLSRYFFMSSLQKLTNSELLSETSTLAHEERRITVEILHRLREIERRKAYAGLGYRSLNEYAVKHLHYSEGSTHRKISAMLALRDAPGLIPKIESGETSVTAIARIQTTIRAEEKLTREKWSVDEK